VGAVIKALASYWGNEKSDPAKVAQLILRLADNEQLPAHLLLGSDAVQFAGQAGRLRTVAEAKIALRRYFAAFSIRRSGKSHITATNM